MPTHRHATITSPLSDELFLLSMHGREELSQPFIYELELASENFDISSEDLLGKSMTVHLETVGQELRHFNGVVARFAFAGSHGRYAAYRATLRPWFWLLSHTVCNSVYQDMRVPDLARMLFRIYGFTDVEPGVLTGTYDKREFMVQYRESTFDFISRWLEHEGIYYYFKHEEGCHKLCLADDSTVRRTVNHYEELEVRAPTVAGRTADDHFEDWQESANVISDVYAVDGYDFKKPRVNLYESSPVPDEKAAERRIFEAPTTHLTPQVAQRYARLHAEELRTGKVTFEGSGNVRGLTPGATFKLDKHPRKSFNKEYCVVSVEYAIHAGEFESSGAGAELQIRTRVRAIEANVPFRPARRIPRPVVAGPESAVVVGTQGSEISSEEYGRIRVQFHWDEEHEKNEDSSCWMRVAQPWAGSDYGFQFIPRVGHEVLVHFLNGNPDQPIVIGSVFNHDNMPPYPVNKHRTQSGIRSRSTKGGGIDDYNELRFEDDKGHEEVHVQAQRDLSVRVKHDSRTDVGHDAKHTIKNNLTVNVVEGDHDTQVTKGAMRAEVKQSLYGVNAKEIALSATDAITLRVGEVSIRIDPVSIALTVDKNAEVKLELANLSIIGTTMVNINPPGVMPMGAAKLPDLLTRVCSASDNAES